MDKKKIESFAKIPQPPQSDWGFIEDIKSPLEYHFDDSRGCDAGENFGCLEKGITLIDESSAKIPATAPNKPPPSAPNGPMAEPAIAPAPVPLMILLA